MEKHHLELNTRKLKILSNVCGAYLKAKDYQNTKLAGDCGLRHMEKSGLNKPEYADAEAKFLYRKGVANLERGFSEDAHEDLKKADAKVPGDRQVRQALKEASEKQKADRKEAKEVFKNHLLTEKEKRLLGPWWHHEVLWHNLKGWCARRCSSSKKRKHK